jgi:hypothetical protein
MKAGTEEATSESGEVVDGKLYFDFHAAHTIRVCNGGESEYQEQGVVEGTTDEDAAPGGGSAWTGEPAVAPLD